MNKANHNYRLEISSLFHLSEIFEIGSKPKTNDE